MSDEVVPVALLDDIWKSYGGIAVLKGVSIDLQRLAHANGVYLVPQEPELFANLSVLENIRLSLGKKTASRAEIRETFDSLGHPIKLEAKASDLSISDQQLVEIARGILRGARLLIVDEPTSALTAREADRLFTVLRSLAESGVGIFYVSHRMPEIFALCNRVTVLRDGAMVLQKATADTSIPELVEAMVPDHTLHAVRERADRPPVPEGAHPGFEVKELTGQGFHDVSLELYSGEVLGIAGVVGSGRTELAETIYGLRPGIGEVVLATMPYQKRSPQKSLEAGLSYVPEDRHEHGVFLAGSIVDNVTSTILDRVSKAGVMNTAAEYRFTDEMADRLAIQAGKRTRKAGNLSGGNQQKVSLAKSLASEPIVIILDEPSRGIDVKARGDLYRLIEELADTGLAVLLISSDFEEIVLLSSRVLVMRDGTITDELTDDDINLEQVRNAAFGALKSEVAQ